MIRTIRRTSVGATLPVVFCALPLAATPAAQNAVILGRILDAETAQVIPGTVVIRTSQSTIVTDNPGFEDGFRCLGQFEKEVPSGETTITVTHGFDDAVSQQKVDLKPGQRLELVFRMRPRAGLRRLGWYGGDNHDHMNHGQDEPQFPVDFAYVALAARAAGLDYLSIAQNWVLPPGRISPAYLTELVQAVSTPDFILTWNMEAPKNYWRGDVTHCLGHCWFLGMRGYTPSGQDAIRALLQMSAGDYQSEKTPAPNFESQALIHSLGGVVAYTHPCRWWWGKWGGSGIYPFEDGKFVSNLAQELPYDTVVGPTYDMIDILMAGGDREASVEAQRLWFVLLNRGYRMPATASTDSDFSGRGHALPGESRVYTHVDGPPSIAAIAEAMKAGKNFVTNGPILLMDIGGHQVGETIRLDRPADFRVRFRAWPAAAVGERLTKVQLIRNGEIVKEFVLSAPREDFAVEFTLHETRSAWYVARCFGSHEDKVAITNPIYFESQDYKPPQHTLAHVTGRVTNAAGQPLAGEYEVVQMVGLDPLQLSKHAFVDGQFVAAVPGTARLRGQAQGYEPLTKSVFLDYSPLLQMALNMREGEITDGENL